VGPLDAEEAARIWSSIDLQGVTLDTMLTESTLRLREERPGGLRERVREIRIPLTGETGILEKTFFSRRPLQSSDSPGSEASVNRELHELLGCVQVAAVPVVAREASLGVLACDNLITRNPISFQQMELMASLAGQAGMAIQNMRTFANVRRRFQELQTLQEVGKGILATVEILHDLGLIARISSQVLGASGTLVHLNASDDAAGGDDRLRVAATFGFGDRIRELGGWRLEEDVAAEVARTGRGQLITRPSPETQPPGLEEPVTTLMSVPLIALDKTVGALSVVDIKRLSRTGDANFTEDDLRFLSILAGQAAIAIENARLFEQVKYTERQLREAQALALRSEKLAALGQVISRVAHEIRNPLAAIGGFARSMRARMGPDDPYRDKVEIIVLETERLERILRTQLSFLHLPEIEWARVDLNQVAEETLSLIRPRAEERGIAIKASLAPGLPPIRADADQLKQVLLNLLQNALESAGREGAVKLTTGRRRRELEARISNSGPPIPPEALPRLFVPFFTTKATGSGLGLPISQDIVKRHGGHIEVAREEDWTVFTVVLPGNHGMPAATVATIGTDEGDRGD